MFDQHKLVGTDCQPEAYICSKKVKPDVWIPPCTVLEVAFDSVSSSSFYLIDNSQFPQPEGRAEWKGLSLRFPRFVRKREDKKPTDCSRYDQISEMFHSSIPTKEL